LTYKSTTDSTLFDSGQYKLKAEMLLAWIKEKLKIGQKKTIKK
jgi:lipopolysaccharide export system permease protein